MDKENSAKKSVDEAMELASYICDRKIQIKIPTIVDKVINENKERKQKGFKVRITKDTTLDDIYETLFNLDADGYDINILPDGTIPKGFICDNSYTEEFVKQCINEYLLAYHTEDYSDEGGTYETPLDYSDGDASESVEEAQEEPKTNWIDMAINNEQERMDNEESISYEVHSERLNDNMNKPYCIRDEENIIYDDFRIELDKDLFDEAFTGDLILKITDYETYTLKETCVPSEKIVEADIDFYEMCTRTIQHSQTNKNATTSIKNLRTCCKSCMAEMEAGYQELEEVLKKLSMSCIDKALKYYSANLKYPELKIGFSMKILTLFDQVNKDIETYIDQSSSASYNAMRSNLRYTIKILNNGDDSRC